MYSVLADLVVLVHFSFILFVIVGAFLTLRWPWIPWLHIPAVLWAVLLEYVGLTCPLTPLENIFREAANEEPSSQGLIERYLLPVIYPGELTREIQIALGTAALALNIGAYLLVRQRLRAHQ